MDEEFLKSLSEILNAVDELEKNRKNVVRDCITRPNGKYYIQTGPQVLLSKGKWMTVLAVEAGDKTYGPACVSEYDSLEEAMEGHYSWQKSVVDYQPTMFRDTKDGEIYVVGS